MEVKAKAKFIRMSPRKVRLVVDVIRGKLLTFSDQSGKYEAADLPDEYKSRADELKEKIVESAAESDDALMEAFFDAGSLTDEQLQQGIRKGLLNRTLIPVFCGSATKNFGTHPFLDFAASARVFNP